MDHTKRQWVDLGNLTEACIVRPETCGAEGGAVAFWIRRTYSDAEYRGVLSSRAEENTGLVIYFRGTNLR